jgi:hypothetical protein
MALANVAWILASAGKRVLTIDWDLEIDKSRYHCAMVVGSVPRCNSAGQNSPSATCTPS